MAKYVKRAEVLKMHPESFIGCISVSFERNPHRTNIEEICYNTELTESFNGNLMVKGVGITRHECVEPIWFFEDKSLCTHFRKLSDFESFMSGRCLHESGLYNQFVTKLLEKGVKILY